MNTERFKFIRVRDAFRFFRRAGFGRIRAFRYARSVVKRGAVVVIDRPSLRDVIEVQARPLRAIGGAR